MKRGFVRLAGWLCLAVLCFAPIHAQESPQPATMRAVRAQAAPTLDGDVAGDPAWSVAQPATGFVQTIPKPGAPASEKTEVFVIFDEERVYVGVICHDRNPEEIVIADTRRDASLEETDSFQMILDTYDDDQSAFLFGTHPAGLLYDGQVTRDGEVDFDDVGGFNLAWDGVWRVAAKVFEGGWSAEFAIPFRTLRFPKGGNPQTWGINFQRNIRRHKEKAFWSQLPRQYDLDKVSLAGRLEGIEVPRQQFLQMVPYVLAESIRGAGGSPDTDEDFDGGVDFKLGLSPSLALDVTINTDFAQVEADVQRVNLDRFNLFFPEKRSFFLENLGNFRVGLPGQIELFHSRRIGLGPRGEVVPIQGGARLSGKVGQNNLGILYMLTDDTESGIPEDEFAVVRVSRDVGKSSSIGMLVTHRESRGSLAEDDDYGRTFALDGRWGIGPKADIRGFVAKTDTPGIEDDDHAFFLGSRYDSGTLLLQASYAEVGEGFNPEVGFLVRRGYRRPEIYALSRHRPKNFLGLQEIRPHIFYQVFYDFDGDKESSTFHFGNHWEFKNGNEVHTGMNYFDDNVKFPFQINPGVIVPAGEYSRTEVQLVGFTNRAAPVSIHVFFIAGGFFDGERVQLIPTLRFRRTEKLTGELSWRHDNINLPFGDFDVDLGRLRLSYSFTPRLFLESLIQYNTANDRWSSNIRFGWRESANTGLFIVYNDTREIGTGNFEDQRQLIVKFSRLFDLWER